VKEAASVAQATSSAMHWFVVTQSRLISLTSSCSQTVTAQLGTLILSEVTKGTAMLSE
jgi:hypothetical protein